MVTLEEILASRDARVELQSRLQSSFPNTTLVVLTVVMPGSVKKCRETEIVARDGVERIDSLFVGKILHKEIRNMNTGFEAFYVIDSIDHEMVKKQVMEIEDSTPLGRLMDIDVFDNNGFPISRISKGSSGRKCIICDKDARICMREMRHSYDEILAHIKKLVEDYVSGV